MINESITGRISPFGVFHSNMFNHWAVFPVNVFFALCTIYISTSIRTAENGTHLHARNGGHPSVAFSRHVDLCNGNIYFIKIVRYFFITLEDNVCKLI